MAIMAIMAVINYVLYIYIYIHPSSEIDYYLAFSDLLAMPYPVHSNTIFISIPFPNKSELDLDYTTTVSDQTLDLSLLLRAFDGAARNQTSISTLRLKFDPQDPKMRIEK